MEKIKQYSALLRLGQWYKNILVFVPFSFFPATLHYDIQTTILAGLGFCLISSITYIENDWIDRENDRLHPTKKDRPLASGVVSGKEALLVTIVLLCFVGMIVFELGNILYLCILGGYFLATHLYSFGFKNIPLVDLGMIAFNFLLRMSAGVGAFPKDREEVFFVLALYLLIFGIVIVFLTHKRRADIKFLGEKKAAQHKKVLAFYTKNVCYSIRIVGYMLFVVSLGMFFAHGEPLLPLLLSGGWLGLTSVLFSRNSYLVLKPHRLIRLWYWDVVGLLTLMTFIIKPILL